MEFTTGVSSAPVDLARLRTAWFTQWEGRAVRILSDGVRRAHFLYSATKEDIILDSGTEWSMRMS